jgi:hypothetical protein
VPPIFQPEVAARAIVGCIGHRRREIFVAEPTVKAVLGAKLVPGYADHRLAKLGYEGQQSELPVDPERRDNLFSPVEGDFGAHGIFDADAKDSSLYARMTLLWTHLRSAVERALRLRPAPLALPSHEKS